MFETSQMELKAERQSFCHLIQESLKSNPLIKSISQVLCRVSVFKELAREYYFEVLLSSYRCPECNGRLQMTGQSQCACSCGKTFDPTLVFQQSPCCNDKLVRKTFHYACSRCHQTVPSRFLFDERLFDKAYFKEMMQESRDRARKKREEVGRLLAESRSDTLILLQEPNLESIPGLSEALDSFIGTQIKLDHFSPNSGFRMNDYRSHILSVLGVGARLFSDIPALIEDRRRDRIWRFVTLVFMGQDGEVSLTQYGADLLVERVQN